MNLSASSLGTFESCPRCFWYEKNRKNPRPRGLFPSLPGGIDRVLKEWANGLRACTGIVPTLETDKGPHKLFEDSVKVAKWQNWRSGLKWPDGKGNFLIGALDDVLTNEAGKFVPLDWKTKGSETNQDDVEKYYQRQLDCYALLLSTAGPEADYGFILSHYPWFCRSDGASIDIENPLKERIARVIHRTTFTVQTFCLKTDRFRAQDLFRRALSCVQSEIAPPSSPGCEYCQFVAGRSL